MKKEYQALEITDGGKLQIDVTRSKFSDLHQFLENIAPTSRARSIALTKLEEASHFAIRAIAEAHEVSK